MRVQGPVRAPPSPRASLVQALERKGYLPGVASPMVERYPGFAETIVKLPRDRSPQRLVRTSEPVTLQNYGAMDGRPLKLLRGVPVSPRDFDAAFTDTRVPLLFFSEQALEPHRYAMAGGEPGRQQALARGQTQGTVIQVQVPSFLTYFYGHPVLRTMDVPDLSPFITAYAAVDLTRPYLPVFDEAELRLQPAPSGAVSAHTKKPSR